ncbi:MAG: hypothetical protein H8E05_01345 [Bacteroidetes bacterium]|nr:hypothetical protein [Bacteroidota bacterium]
MRIIKNGAKHIETLPLPCWRDEEGVLQYDSEWADDLVVRAYGDDIDKYEINTSTLELFYKVSNKTKYRIAKIDYESFYTDIKGSEYEADFLEMYHNQGQDETLGELEVAEDYEIYNLTLYHFDNKSIKSTFIDEKSKKLKGINTEEYIKQIMKMLKKNEQ